MDAGSMQSIGGAIPLPLTEKKAAAPESPDRTARDNVSIGDSTGARVSADSIPLTILHTNDIHGHAEPFTDNNKLVGGIAHLAERIKKERAEDPDHTLLLDAGDSVQGSPISDFFNGKPIAEAMNDIAYDVMTLGNHDFDNGVRELAENINGRNAPALAANLVNKKKDSPLQGKTRPYVMKIIDGVKIGIIGLITPDTIKTLHSKEDAKLVEFADPAATLEHYIPEMKKQGADIIILLSHLGVDEDPRIADRFPDIDVIVGGHSHTDLTEPMKRGNTIIVQAGCFGKELGRVDLSIDKETKRVHLKNYSLIPVAGDSTESDSRVDAIVKKYAEIYGPVMNQKIASLPRDLTQLDYHKFRAESNLGDAITDIFRAQSGADIGFIGASGLRCNLYKGDLKVSDIYSLIPWKEQLATVQMKGKDITPMLEEGLGMVGIAFSGIKAVIDTNRPQGSQVVSVAREDGSPLEPETYYTIATRDYITEGNLGFNSMSRAKSRKDHGEIREKIIDWIKSPGNSVRTEMDGRLVNLAMEQKGNS